MERKTLIYLSTLTFVIGIALFALRNEWIIIHIPALFRPTGTSVVALEKKSVAISFYKQESWHTENLETIWEQNANAKNSARLAGAYFTLLYEEALTEQKIGVEATSTDPKGTTLFLSLTHNPLPAEASVKEKVMIIEGLLRTLREALPELTKIMLLVHHQPLTDYHLDFTQPWELTGWLQGHSDYRENSQEVAAVYQRAQTPHKFKLLLDPTGDAQYTGRIIEDTFERGVSLQVAQEVKHALEDLHPEISTLLTRIPGETVEPLQNATFANRLPADLFVHIGITSHAKQLPTISVYVLNATPTNLIPSGQTATNKPLSFEPYTQAHESISPVSFAQAQAFVRELKSLGAQLPATIATPVALPFHPLVGMSIPAFGIEIAVKSKDELKAIILPLAHALGQLSITNA